MRIITLSLFAVLLSACNSVEVQQKTNTNNEALSSIESASFETWMTLARSAENEEIAASYFLSAAEAKNQEKDYAKALEILTENVINLNTQSTFKGLLLAANISNLQNTPLKALSYLSKAKRNPLSNHPNNANKISILRSESLEQLENWPAAVKERLKLSLSLPLEEIDYNQQQLWSDIQNLTDSETLYLQNGNDSILNGWLSISSILRQNALTTSEQLNAFTQWQLRNQFHPAATAPPKDFLILSDIDELTPKNITLLLPLTGKLRDASQAILDGFLYSHFAQPPPRAEVHLIDTDTTNSMEEALVQAAFYTPDIIIGPLQKSHLAELNHLDLNTPLIALNRLDNQPVSPNLFHFSLNARDEIIELIRHAQSEGAKTTAVISTQDTWALRQADEFRYIAENNDVELLTQLDYENTPKSRQDTIKKLLLVDESQRRKKWLESKLSTDITSAERSRQDLDYIFFAGRFADAKQIRPLLDFYFASNIPLLATSTINNKQLDGLTKEEDIERIIFNELPSIVRAKNDDLLFNRNDSNFIKRLKSLGQDAHLLANRFPIFQQVSNAKMSGSTGILSLDKNQIFNKRTELVTYKQGRLINAKETSPNE
ncbi:penicillin-binding protein activator [Marinomonas sp. 15G1-11]|uniref:Penicillin-binding protein activator n=1 Tax=Marinomonas phaeophyticola TaxID=3004091 RepID=A0ABT4JXV2_9GAMM|nr:penicillin-binding protein activator [Marinomonas sp. 15G1-11]MCZ2723061.1 penicillin-binding protein activator [Marinomonas sp. 15G1-11]